jgi:2-methylisocitrate lyase-like PEP mutase family enzyme
VGVNIEDAHTDPVPGDPLRPAGEQAERLAAARAAAERAGIPLYLNARIDVYLYGAGKPSGRLAETLRRAAIYLDAGATGVFVPGVADPGLIAELAAGIDAPLNILVGPGSPAVAELGRLGVARASLGSAVAGAAYALVDRAARELLATGTYESVREALDFQQLNSLMKHGK